MPDPQPTLQQIGDAVGASKAMAGRWRSGKGFPHIANGVALSKFLGVNFEWLMTGCSDMRQTSHLSDEIQFLIPYLVGLSPSGLKDVMSYTAYVMDREGDGQRRETFQEFVDSLAGVQERDR